MARGRGASRASASFTSGKQASDRYASMSALTWPSPARISSRRSAQRRAASVTAQKSS